MWVRTGTRACFLNNEIPQFCWRITHFLRKIITPSMNWGGSSKDGMLSTGLSTYPAFNETPLNRWIAAVHQRTTFKGLKYLVLIRVSRSRDQELELFSCINDKYCRIIHPLGFEQVEILRQIYQVSEVNARRLITLSSEVTNWTAWIGRLKIVQKSTVSFRALLKL